MNAGNRRRDATHLLRQEEHLTSLLALERLLRYAEAEAVSLEQNIAAEIIGFALQLIRPSGATKRHAYRIKRFPVATNVAPLRKVKL